MRLVEKIKETGKKKVAVIAVATTLAVTTIGGGAYAYKDEWTAKIQQGVSMLADHVFGGAITTAVTQHGDAKENELKGVANNLISGLTKELKEFKDAEIKRGKDAIDAKYNADVDRITAEANKAKEAEKREQKAKTDTAIQGAKSDMDAVIESYLNQIK